MRDIEVIDREWAALWDERRAHKAANPECICNVPGTVGPALEACPAFVEWEKRALANTNERYPEEVEL